MRSRMILLPLLALGVGIYFWQTTANANVPACTWRTGTGTDIEQGENFEALGPESPIRLSVVCKQARHLYVFSHSAEDEIEHPRRLIALVFRLFERDFGLLKLSVAVRQLHAHFAVVSGLVD